MSDSSSLWERIALAALAAAAAVGVPFAGVLRGMDQRITKIETLQQEVLRRVTKLEEDE